MRAELVAYYLADPGVAAIAGVNVSWGWRLQGSPLPAATLFKTDGPDDVTLDGASGFVDGRVQIDCYGATLLDSSNLADAIRAASAGVNVATTGVIQGAFVLHEADENEGEKPDRVFRTRLSLRIAYSS
jgi:hypothetical protein